jgi:transcriptional regulator with XRE-family HTH domain
LSTRDRYRLTTGLVRCGILQSWRRSETGFEEIRKKLNVSERELGRRSGLAEQHIGLLKKAFTLDPNANVTVNVLKQVADAGGVRLAWLVTGEGERDLPTELTIERPERYPNFAAVIQLYRGDVHPAGDRGCPREVGRVPRRGSHEAGVDRVAVRGGRSDPSRGEDGAPVSRTPSEAETGTCEVTDYVPTIPLR